MSAALKRRRADGWELVTAFDTTGGSGGTRTVRLIFKRPRAD